MLKNALKVKCNRGHDLTDPDNFRVYGGKRQCLTCQRAYQRIRGGWPIDLAFSTPRQQLGQRPKGIGTIWAKRGDITLKPPKPIMERFMSNVTLAPGCWEWNGPKNETGYGRFFFEGRNQKAHRVAYQLMIGPIPPSDYSVHGTMVMHTCDNPKCVNPLHLRLGTAADNVADAKQKGRLTGNKGRRYLTEASS
jgi:hypothetical protein